MDVLPIIGYVGGAIGVIVGVVGYFGGQRKTSNAEVEKRAHFEGTMEAKLEQISEQLNKIEDKLSKNTDALYAEIDKAIAEHERRYHSDK